MAQFQFVETIIDAIAVMADVEPRQVSVKELRPEVGVVARCDAVRVRTTAARKVARERFDGASVGRFQSGSSALHKATEVSGWAQIPRRGRPRIAGTSERLAAAEARLNAAFAALLRP